MGPCSSKLYPLQDWMTSRQFPFAARALDAVFSLGWAGLCGLGGALVHKMGGKVGVPCHPFGIVLCQTVFEGACVCGLVVTLIGCFSKCMTT